jgi:hypothetical protein
MATQTTDSFQRPSQLDFKLRQVAAPEYKMVRIPLNNLASSSVSIPSQGSQVLEWKLPVRVYNLARSYISYSMTVPSPGAGLYSNTFEDSFDLGSSISFGGAGGVELVNLQNAQNYTKIARKIATAIDDFMGNDDMSGLYKANTTNGALPAAGNSSNIVPGGYSEGPINYIATDSYLESKYMASGAIVNTALTRHRQYPLGAFVGTLLGVDRDFFSPVEQYLRVQTSNGNKMAFSSTSAPGVAVAGAAVQVGNINVSNVYLYLCVEQNQLVVDDIYRRLAEGKLAYRIPYTTSFKNVGSPANAQTNISIQLSQQYGRRLKRILHTVFNPTELSNTAYDCSNYNGTKVASYQTFLDTMPIQDRILSCLLPTAAGINQDDWLENKKYLDRRSCYLSKEMYAINWFHIDQFFEPHDKDGSLPEVNLDEGKSMDTAKQWLFSCTAGSIAGLLHYTYAEFARDILVTNAGPMFV